MIHIILNPEFLPERSADTRCGKRAFRRFLVERYKDADCPICRKSILESAHTLRLLFLPGSTIINEFREFHGLNNGGS